MNAKKTKFVLITKGQTDNNCNDEIKLTLNNAIIERIYSSILEHGLIVMRITQKRSNVELNLLDQHYLG